jgi:hypothetical protein
VPTSALTDAHLPDSPPPLPPPSFSAAELHSCSRYSAPPTPRLAGLPVRPPSGVRVPRWPAGPRWGSALLTSAREMLASANIFN